VERFGQYQSGEVDRSGRISKCGDTLAARASICSAGFGGRSISHNQRGIDLAFASVEEDLGPVAHSPDDCGFSPAPRGQSQLPVFWGTLVTI